MNITNCRACGAPIGFIKTFSGKTVPVDAEPVTFFPDEAGDMLLIMQDGTARHGRERKPDEKGFSVGYISHFATCPEADKFRKPRKSDRKKG